MIPLVDKAALLVAVLSSLSDHYDTIRGQGSITCCGCIIIVQRPLWYHWWTGLRYLLWLCYHRSAPVVIPLVDKAALLVVAVLSSLSDHYHTIDGEDSVTCCGCHITAHRPLWYHWWKGQRYLLWLCYHRSATVIIPLVDRIALLAVAVILPLTARCDTIGGKGSVTCCGCVTIAQRPLWYHWWTRQRYLLWLCYHRSTTIIIPLVDRIALLAVAVILPLTARCDTIGGKGSITCCGCVTIAQRLLWYHWWTRQRYLLWLCYHRSTTIIIPLVDRIALLAVAVILPLTARCDTIGGKGSITCCGCVTIAQRLLRYHWWTRQRYLLWLCYHRSVTIMIPLVDRIALLAVAVILPLIARFDTIGGKGSVTCCGCVTIAQRPLSYHWWTG